MIFKRNKDEKCIQKDVHSQKKRIESGLNRYLINFVSSQTRLTHQQKIF